MKLQDASFSTQEIVQVCCSESSHNFFVMSAAQGLLHTLSFVN